MDAKILQQIKEDLLNRKAGIIKELANFATKTDAEKNEYISRFPQYGNESDDNAQEVNQYTTNIEAERILENSLKDIDASLKKIDKDEYGICKYCGKEIEIKRLLIRPDSSACVSCKRNLQNQK
jgi:RNA polymerase-binding transcription factor DksA